MILMCIWVIRYVTMKESVLVRKILNYPVFISVIIINGVTKFVIIFIFNIDIQYKKH